MDGDEAVIDQEMALYKEERNGQADDELKEELAEVIEKARQKSLISIELVSLLILGIWYL